MTKFLSTIVAVIFTISASAQFYLGPRLGANYSKSTTNQAGYNTKFAPGFHGGLGMFIKLHKQFNITGDVLFSSATGNKYLETIEENSGNVLTTRIESDITITSLLIPITADFEMPFKKKLLIPYRDKPSSVSFHLFGGGYFAYNLGGTNKTTTRVKFVDANGELVSDDISSSSSNSGGSIVFNDLRYDLSSFNPIGAGLVFGTGFSFGSNIQRRFRVDIRYNMALSNDYKINKKNVSALKEVAGKDYPIPAAEKSKMTNLQLSLAYYFKPNQRKYYQR